MIKLYGPPASAASRCIVALEEVGQPYELVRLDMKAKAHKTPEYLALNPNGKVPTLVDGDFVLWESFAINHYLAEKFKPELLGRTIEERALVRQWTDWCVNHVMPHLSKVTAFLFYNRGTEAQANEGRMDVVPFLEILDKHLAGHSFIVADVLTLADLDMACVLMSCQRINFDLSPFTEVERWLKVMLHRPSFKTLSTLQPA